MKAVEDITPDIEMKRWKRLEWRVELNEDNTKVIEIDFIPTDEGIIKVYELTRRKNGEIIFDDISVENGEVIINATGEELAKYTRNNKLTLWVKRYLVETTQMKRRDWNNYWREYEEQNLLEIFRQNYIEHIKEKQSSLESIKFSDSILSAPYSIEKKWKLFEFEYDDERNLKMLTDVDGVLVDIPYFLTEDYEIFEIDHIIVNQEVRFSEDINKDNFKLWAPKYYIHNSLILDRLANLLEFNNSIFKIDKYSEQYFNMLKGLWYVLANGPTVENIEIALYILFGLPMTFNDEEISEVSHDRIVTSHRTWNFSDYFIARNFKEGRRLRSGDKISKLNKLVKGLEIKDYLSDPKWWEGEIQEINKYTYVYLPLDEEVFGDMGTFTPHIYNFLNRVFPKYCHFRMRLNLGTLEPREPRGYTLSTMALGNGSIEVEPYRDRYEENQVVTIKAIPDDGEELVDWIWIDEEDEEIEITMDEHKFIIAEFTEEGQEIEHNIPDDPDDPDDPDAEYILFLKTDGKPGKIKKEDQEKVWYKHGEEVRLEAVPTNEDDMFQLWSGTYFNDPEVDKHKNPITITITENTSIIATFIDHVTERDATTDARGTECKGLETKRYTRVLDGHYRFIDSELEFEVKKLIQGYLDYANHKISRKRFNLIDSDIDLSHLEDLFDEGYNEPVFLEAINNRANKIVFSSADKNDPPKFTQGDNYSTAEYILFLLCFVAQPTFSRYFERGCKVENKEYMNMYEELQIEGLEPYEII